MPRPGSSLHADMLHAIATKERLCLELREQLQNEEAQLNKLRSAWQRLAVRGGVKVVPSPVPTAKRAEALQRRKSTILAPSKVQARRTEQVTASPTRASSSNSSPTKPTDSSWRARIPQQLSSWVEQVAPTHEQNMPRNPAHDVAQWLHSREAEDGGTPRSARAGQDGLSRTGAAGSPSSARPHDIPDLPAEHPPLLPPKDAEGLGDRLVSGWNVLSKRLVETTSSLTDPHAWNDGLTGPPSSRGSLPRDYMNELPSSNSSDTLRHLSSMTLPPGAGTSMLGLRSMASQARQAEDELSPSLPEAPPVPPKTHEGRGAPRDTREADAPPPPNKELSPTPLGADDGDGDAGYAANLIDMDDSHNGGVRRLEILDDKSDDASLSPNTGREAQDDSTHTKDLQP
ncbi:hypothetical protein MOBT1_000964 [Malassezia obtusa]|uniref:Uncharacterized protein n=1 Tax=Malassezia obtusa TaxID=76774 RepID=A0AAF0IRB4_9BASI|nr:hypothetical protein MOBT1_000964 [Malassezia obtusa]